jgi:hypothetical protein
VTKCLFTRLVTLDKALYAINNTRRFVGIFDLVFVLCFLAAMIVLVLATNTAIRGNHGKALARLRKLGICAAIYVAVVLAAAVGVPREVYHLRDARCFDDWCIAVTNFTRTPKSVEVELRLSSRAKRAPQGEKGTVVYLVDSQGCRYNPDLDSGTISFDTLLQPGESVVTTRRFVVSDKVRALNLIYTHEGGFPIDCFIIGQNTWFHGPPVVQLE